RVSAEVHRGQAHGRRRPTVPGPRPGEHVGAIRREYQLEQRTGEARARLDERDHRARGDVEALERALEVEPDLAHEPVVPLAGEQPIVGLDPVGPPRGLEHPESGLRLVRAQMEDEIVELTRERGTTSSTSPHSTARWPLTPSSVVQKTSARSRRTRRLSTSRVSPPVPGRTARSGTSGSETAVLPSSAMMIQSVASASS